MKTLSCFVLSLLAAAGGLRADQPVDESRPAAPDVQIQIENLSGSVRVTGWNEDRIRVTGTVGDDTEGLKIEGDRNAISIEVEIPDRHGRRSLGGRDYDADLEIWVPTGSRLSVETVSAWIEVSDLEGTLELESVSGKIEAGGRPQEAELSTVSGSIRFTGSQTSISAESVSGSVRLEGVAGRVEVSTVSGNIEVVSDVFERGELETVSGRIDFEGDLAPRGRLDIEGHSSNITVALPASVSASFEVETFSGRIKSDWGPEAVRVGRYSPGMELEFSTGTGEARVTIDSFSGSVWLKQK